MKYDDKTAQAIKAAKRRKKAYRTSLGFSTQGDTKDYFKAKDVYSVNWPLVENYNDRLVDIFEKINSVITSSYKLTADEMAAFSAKISAAYQILKETEIIQDKFHNQGRSSENVYYNWMRGYAVNVYFMKLIAALFQVDENEIEQLGKDNIEQLIATRNPEVFNREAVADLQIRSKQIHIEVQAGFTGENDIKQSKAEDAKKRYREEHWTTFVVHFDLYNGELAVINITSLYDNLPEDGWKENPRFETVFTTKIPDNCFKWYITTELPSNPETLYSILA